MKNIIEDINLIMPEAGVFLPTTSHFAETFLVALTNNHLERNLK